MFSGDFFLGVDDVFALKGLGYYVVLWNWTEK